MERQTNLRKGNAAENKFVELVNGARLSDTPTKGNVIVSLDDREFYVAINHCETDPGTINQVRAIKYTPCVVWATLRNKWYVLPPNRLVRMAANKERGQHTEIAFECMNITLPRSGDIPGAISCTDDQLEAGIQEAILEGEKYPECRTLMDSLLNEIQALKADYKKKTEDVFE